MSMLMSANASKIMVDGKDVRGVTSLDYKVARNKEDIQSIDTEERHGGYYGALKVTGSIKVKSAYEPLDKLMFEKVPKIKTFQIVVQMFPQGAESKVRQLTFDECILEGKSMALGANGVAETTYEFSATRMREE